MNFELLWQMGIDARFDRGRCQNAADHRSGCDDVLPGEKQSGDRSLGAQAVPPDNKSVCVAVKNATEADGPLQSAVITAKRSVVAQVSAFAHFGGCYGEHRPSLVGT